MRVISTFIMVALFGSILPVQQLQRRQLLLFGMTVAPEMGLNQMKLLDSAMTGIKEREVDIRVILKGSPMYQQYEVLPHEFAVVLVGKDGSEKYRKKNIIQPIELFAIIDAMPMRKTELQRKQQQ